MRMVQLVLNDWTPKEKCHLPVAKSNIDLDVIHRISYVACSLHSSTFMVDFPARTVDYRRGKNT